MCTVNFIRLWEQHAKNLLGSLETLSNRTDLPMQTPSFVHTRYLYTLLEIFDAVAQATCSHEHPLSWPQVTFEQRTRFVDNHHGTTSLYYTISIVCTT